MSGEQNNSYPGNLLAITPSDTVPLAKVVRCIRSTTPGTITVVNVDGTTAVGNWAAGETQVVCATKIMATGTTATGITGIY